VAAVLQAAQHNWIKEAPGVASPSRVENCREASNSLHQDSAMVTVLPSRD
jgi:hypothetical protein